MKALLCLLLLAASPLAFAVWKLDPERSQVSFVTIKAQDVAEVHRFTELSGEVTPDGTATVTIQLASVDTMIPIRDERMREMLFQTGVFPTASVLARLDMKSLEAIPPGGTLEIASELILNLHGHEVPFTAELLVARLSDQRILATTLKPVVVTAASVGLTEGVEALREVAGLPSISQAVPVTIVLTFDAAR